MKGNKDVKREKSIKYLSVMIVVGLLILRFPLLIILSFFHIGMPSDTINKIYTNGTYLLTAGLILIERNNLARFKINFLAIAIFFLAPILKPIINVVTIKYTTFVNFSLLQIIISILLSILLILSHVRIHNDKLKYHVKWIILSVLIGALTALGTGLVYSLFFARMDKHPSLAIFVGSYFTQLSNAAVMEEPLFRGFIWGYLDKKGWKQIWIWLFQAGIFCIGHIYYLPQYPVIFAGTFVAALIFGLLVWRSKNIGTSMIAHAMANSLGALIMQYTW